MIKMENSKSDRAGKTRWLSYLPITIGAAWCLLGLLVLTVFNTTLATALFLPVCFPANVILLLIPNAILSSLAVQGYFPAAEPFLIVIIPLQNLILGYIATLIYRKYRRKNLFRKISLVVEGLLFLIYVIFIIPLIEALQIDDPHAVQRAFTKLQQDKINAVSPKVNAATYYKQAIKMVGNIDLEALCPGAFYPPQTPWKADEYPAWAKWLGNHQEVLDLIKEGAQQPTLAGPITVLELPDYMDWYPSEDDGQGAWKVTQIAQLQTGLSLGEKGIEESLPQVLTTIKMLEQFHEPGWLITAIIYSVSEDSFSPLLREALLSDSLKAQTCRILIKELEKLDAMHGDLLKQSLLFELNFNNLWLYDLYRTPAVLNPGDSTLQKVLVSLSWRFNTLLTPFSSTMALSKDWLDALDNLIYTPQYSPGYDEAKKRFQLAGDRINTNCFLAFSSPKFYDLADQDRQANAERRLTILLAGLRLYRLENGIYPESLDQLVPDYLTILPPDPLSDKPWIYKKENGEITIASNKGDGEVISFCFPDESIEEQPGKKDKNQTTSTGRLRSVEMWTDEEVERWEGESGAKFPGDLDPIH